MKDRELALELCTRLNRLLAIDTTGEIRTLLQEFCTRRIPVSEYIAGHSSFQTAPDKDGKPEMGLIGLLNGILGVVNEGQKAGSGYLCGDFKGSELQHFLVTVDTKG